MPSYRQLQEQFEHYSAKEIIVFLDKMYANYQQLCLSINKQAICNGINKNIDNESFLKQHILNWYHHELSDVINNPFLGLYHDNKPFIEYLINHNLLQEVFPHYINISTNNADETLHVIKDLFDTVQYTKKLDFSVSEEVLMAIDKPYLVGYPGWEKFLNNDTNTKYEISKKIIDKYSIFTNYNKPNLLTDFLLTNILKDKDLISSLLAQNIKLVTQEMPYLIALVNSMYKLEPDMKQFLDSLTSQFSDNYKEKNLHLRDELKEILNEIISSGKSVTSYAINLLEVCKQIDYYFVLNESVPQKKYKHGFQKI